MINHSGSTYIHNGSGHGGATVLLPGFVINSYQNQVTRHPNLRGLTQIRDMNSVIIMCATLTCAIRARWGISLWIFVTSYTLAPTTRHYPESSTRSQKLSRNTDSWWIRTSVISPNHMIWVPSNPAWHVSHRISSHERGWSLCVVLIDPSQHAYNTLDKYHTIHHFVKQLWATFAHFCSKMLQCGIWDWCIMRYGIDALWDLYNMCIREPV